MFSTLVIADVQIDHGAIAEALVYYGHVGVMTNGQQLAALVQKIGFDTLIRCLEMGVIDLIYNPSGFGVQNPQEGGSLFSIMQFSLVPEKFHGTPTKKPVSMADDLDERFRKAFGATKLARKQARILTQHCRPFELHPQIVEGAKRDILDKEYMRELIQVMSAEKGCQPERDFRLVAKEFDGKILFNADVDYKNSGLTPGNFLVTAVAVREQLIHAASRNSEVWISPKYEGLVGARINTLARAMTKSDQNINRFQKVEFEGRSFREAINLGEKNFSDLLTLIEQEEARKFKSWLNSLPPSAELIKEYDRAIFGESLITKSLGYKSLRSLLFMGIGVGIGVATDGLGTSGAVGGAVVGELLSETVDFLGSKMLAGWKPNQFIDEAALKFLKDTSDER